LYKEKAFQKKHYTHSKETKNLEMLINAALRSQDSSANIVTRPRARQRETVFRFPALGEIFFFLCIETPSGANPTYHSVGTCALFHRRNPRCLTPRTSIWCHHTVWNLNKHCRGVKHFCDIKISHSASNFSVLVMRVGLVMHGEASPLRKINHKQI
jgi:hypothetical protein